MSDTDSPLNFFRTEAKKSKQQTPDPTPIKSASPPAVTLEQTSPTNANKDRLQELSTRMTRLNKDIENKMNELSKQGNLTKEQVWAWVKNNLSKAEIEQISSSNTNIYEKIKEILGRAPETHQVTSATPLPSSVIPSTRKGKFAGVRNKWIPTR